MSKYKVQVKIEIVECNDNDVKEQELTSEKDGCFSMTISEKDAISIDSCEKSVLMTAYPTIREAISRHLTEISKKNS